MSPQVTVQVKMNRQQDNKVIKVSHQSFTCQQHKRPNPTQELRKPKQMLTRSMSNERIRAVFQEMLLTYAKDNKKIAITST
jgi:hypothetical protein